MPTNKKRKAANHFAHILPFPVFPLISAPAMITANGTIYRASLALAFSYWLSGCRDLPADTSSLATLARMPQSNYKPIKSAVEATLAELLPMLADEYDRQFRSKQHMRAIAKLASETAHAKMRAQRNKGAHADATIPKPISAPRLHPTIAPPHRNPRVDMQARQQATERQYTAATPLDDNGNATDRSNAPNVRGNAPLPVKRHAPTPHAPMHHGMLQEPSPRRL